MKFEYGKIDEWSSFKLWPHAACLVKLYSNLRELILKPALFYLPKLKLKREANSSRLSGEFAMYVHYVFSTCNYSCPWL